MTAVQTFIARNTVVAADGLPLVHTTKSYNIGTIKNAEKIAVSECDVFLGEKLNYFFVGRPAYKRPSDGSQAEYWELPCCFIFDLSSITNIRRIFPFDSGAFSRGLYPDYMKAIPRDQFEMQGADSPQRIIGSLFGSARAYFDMQPKSRDSFEAEYQLGPLDAEVKALRRLADDGTPGGFDDRRLTIEVQSDADVDLLSTPPIAVVLPSIYLKDPGVRSKIIDDWKAHPLTYEVYSLSQDKYNIVIYQNVERFYKDRKFL